MARYIMRLDDASDYMDIEKWNRMEQLLDKYGIKPIYGIIPDNHDESLRGKYQRDPKFWEKMHAWEAKGWTPAMHGFEHKYVTDQGGINPVNKRSEFAGLSYEEQADKIEQGWRTLNDHGFHPDIFFAPSHTFDENTLKALNEKTTIRVISDTIANDVYKRDEFWFIPQQSGSVRKLPFKTVTFCYHPNTMTDKSFEDLEAFLAKENKTFLAYSSNLLKTRRISFVDQIISGLYFMRK